jgi:chemotaxis protein CheX
MAQNQSALIIYEDIDLAERLKKAISSVSKEFSNVTTPNPLNAIDRFQHTTFDLLVVPEKNRTISGTYVIKKLEEAKNIKKPKHYVLITEQKPEGLSLNNLTILSPQIAEQELLETIKGVISSLAANTQAPVARIDVNFINPFIESTLDVLKTLCQTTCRKERAFLRANETVSGDISAIVGMVSATFRGSMGIAFEKSTFLYLVNSMLGEKYTSITPENQDAAGEICNQIFGQTKTKLKKKGKT